MTKHPQTAANTRYAFTSIAAMLVAFLLFVAVMLLPLGLTADTQVILIRFSLYAIVLFAVLGGIFSVRVDYLRKKNGA
ncbi:cytochrome b6 [Neisseria sp. P0001.S009]|uniref:cytochrome b6 n=1 Tax=unclassified Neisseria TaxID=2623750 RepID=UPI0036149994